VLEVLAQQEVHPLLHEHGRLLPELLLHVGLGHPGEVGGALGQATEGEGAALLGDIEGEGLHHDGPALRRRRKRRRGGGARRRWRGGGAPEDLPGCNGDGVEEPALHLLHQGGLALLAHRHVHRGQAHQGLIKPAVHQAALQQCDVLRGQTHLT